MSIHHKALQHLAKSKQLIAVGGDDELRYAALELRYCIENLFYELIPHYKDELPDTVMRNDIWRPADIIDMIAEIDPGVHHDRTLSFGPQPAPGVAAKEMYSLGKQSGLRKDLARRIYHGLGAYLHARVDQEPHNYVRLRTKLLKVLPLLEKFEGDRVIMSGFAMRSTFNCEGCGRIIKQRIENTEIKVVTCPNTKCGAIYEYFEENGQPRHRMLQQNVKCHKCGTDNWFGEHKLRRGAEERATFNCFGCKRKYQFLPYVMIRDLSAETEQPSGAAV